MKSVISLLTGICCCVTIVILVAFSIVFIVFGSIGTYKYVDARGDQVKYDAKTECLVLKIRVSTTTCNDEELSRCYNEEFDVSYVIFNSTKITSLISTKNVDHQRNVQVSTMLKCL